jgi:hypothetical protein
LWPAVDPDDRCGGTTFAGDGSPWPHRCRYPAELPFLACCAKGVAAQYDLRR